MTTETTSINISGIPIALVIDIRKLAAVEEKGKLSPQAIKLLQEALEARKEKQSNGEKINSDRE